MYRNHSHSGTFGGIATTLVIAAMLVAGCGDDGSDGAQGPEGQQGPPGPSGGTALPVERAEKINVDIDSIEVGDGGTDVTVSFRLANDDGLGLKGMPADDIRFVISQLSPGQNGGSSEWQAYTTRASVDDFQATTERGSEGAFTDNGDGTYTYTFANALPDYPNGPEYDETKTHRVGIEIRLEGSDGEDIPANNAPTDFLPTGGSPTFTRLIVDTDTCNACHDRFEFHGGARNNIEYCVLCHNPSSIDGESGNTVDMKILIHNIHSARPDYTIIGRRGTEYNWADVHFPQDLRNCQTCHDESDDNTPQASNWRLVPNRAACGTCHYDDGIADSGNDFAIENGIHPGGFTFNDDTQCVDCHGPNGSVTNPEGRLVQVPVAHEIREQTAGKAFEYNILDVNGTAPGEFPTVTFSVTNPLDNDAAYDISADEPFIQCAGGASRLAVDIGWSTTEYANIGSGALPGLPITLNVLEACGGSATNTGGNIFEATSATRIPLDATGSLAVVLEGHPAVDVYNTASYERIAVKTAISYAPITDGSAQARRDVVKVDKCLDCHQELTIHGNNRTDEPQACVVCHNPSMTDINRRTNAPGEDCAAGSDDQTIDFKRMIHQIHVSGELETTVNICGFGSRLNVLEAEYPGQLNNCEGCHLPGTYYPVDPAEVFGTTVDVNDPAILTDDVVLSPTVAVCSACHTDTLATEHMDREGGDFAATKAPDGSLVSSKNEGCVLCHGPGRTADVKVVHEIETFEFN
ncbi:MAG: OmcA/MtrC family decaheme c-type cytochrome [Gammaproteobacteria bacterium]|jgi:OmcA/MtrC family decaheme c-type cytochrome